MDHVTVVSKPLKYNTLSIYVCHQQITFDVKRL